MSDLMTEAAPQGQSEIIGEVTIIVGFDGSSAKEVAVRKGHTLRQVAEGAGLDVTELSNYRFTLLTKDENGRSTASAADLDTLVQPGQRAVATVAQANGG